MIKDICHLLLLVLKQPFSYGKEAEHVIGCCLFMLLYRFFISAISFFFIVGISTNAFGYSDKSNYYDFSWYGAPVIMSNTSAVKLHTAIVGILLKKSSYIVDGTFIITNRGQKKSVHVGFPLSAKKTDHWIFSSREKDVWLNNEKSRDISLNGFTLSEKSVPRLHYSWYSEKINLSKGKNTSLRLRYEASYSINGTVKYLYNVSFDHKATPMKWVFLIDCSLIGGSKKILLMPKSDVMKKVLSQNLIMYEIPSDTAHNPRLLSVGFKHGNHDDAIPESLGDGPLDWPVWGLTNN